MKLFGQVFGPTIQIPEYYLVSKKTRILNMNTTIRSDYWNSIWIPNYSSHPGQHWPFTGRQGWWKLTILIAVVTGSSATDWESLQILVTQLLGDLMLSYNPWLFWSVWPAQLTTCGIPNRRPPCQCLDSLTTYNSTKPRLWESYVPNKQTCLFSRLIYEDLVFMGEIG